MTFAPAWSPVSIVPLSLAPRFPLFPTIPPPRNVFLVRLAHPMRSSIPSTSEVLSHETSLPPRLPLLPFPYLPSRPLPSSPLSPSSLPCVLEPHTIIPILHMLLNSSPSSPSSQSSSLPGAHLPRALSPQAARARRDQGPAGRGGPFTPPLVQVGLHHESPLRTLQVCAVADAAARANPQGEGEDRGEQTDGGAPHSVSAGQLGGWGVGGENIGLPHSLSCYG